MFELLTPRLVLQRIAATGACVICAEPLPFATRSQVGADEWVCGYPCDARWVARNAHDPRDRLAAACDLPYGEDEVELTVDLWTGPATFRGFVMQTSWTPAGCGGRHRLVVVEDGDERSWEFRLGDVLACRVLGA